MRRPSLTEERAEATEPDDEAAPEEGSEPSEGAEKDPLLRHGGGVSSPRVAEADGRVIRRVLIIGASSIEGALGIELERKLERIPGVTVLRWGRRSTGLARLDYFDWLAKAESLVTTFHPDLVLAQLGGNDGQAITKARGGVVAALGSPNWERRYRGRMEEFTTLLASNGAELLYLGMPIPRDEVVRRRMALANRASKAAVEAIGQRYFSTWALTASPAGGYLTKMQIGGRERGLRAPDGFHLSTVGSGFVAGRVIGYLRASFTLPDEEAALPVAEGSATAPSEPTAEHQTPAAHPAHAPSPEASGGP